MRQETGHSCLAACRPGIGLQARVTGGLLLVLVGCLTTQARAAVIAPAGLSPGDSFRVVFVTSTGTTAVSTSIGYYDGFVTNRATIAGLNIYNGQPVLWQVIGSTAAVLASSPGRNAAATDTSPIYRVDGLLVANNGADLWDGSALNPINRDEFGLTSNQPVWTGTLATGSTLAGAVLGSVGPVLFGQSFATGGPAMSAGFGSPFGVTGVYGISERLTIPVPAPEPVSLAIMGVGLGGLAWARRRHSKGDRSAANRGGA